MRKIFLVGALVLVLLALTAGILSVFWFSLGPALRGGISLGQPPLSMLPSATAEAQQKLTVSGPVNLTVDIDHGNITINASEASDSQVDITIQKTAYGVAKGKANERLEAMKVSITQSGNTIEIRYRSPSLVNLNQGSPDSVDVQIAVPKDVSLNAHTGSGYISATGTNGDASLLSDYGDITVNKLEGGLKADTSSGKILVDGVVSGDSDIGLHSDYGSVTLKNSSGSNVQLSSSSGDLDLEQVESAGKIELESSYGAIEYSSGTASSLHIQASSGKITLSSLTIQGELFAHSDYGDIELERARAATYDLDTSSGVVSVDGLSGSLKAHSGYGSIKVTNASQATVDLNSNSGDINFSGSLGSGPHSLVTSYGSIQIYLPPNSGLNVDLKTDYGKVKSDIPVTLSGTIQSDHWIGKLNSGGPSLTAQTSSGDINITVLNPQ